jgi:hypothetical protein
MSPKENLYASVTFIYEKFIPVVIFWLTVKRTAAQLRLGNRAGHRTSEPARERLTSSAK